MEFHFQKGHFVALSSKCYYAFDEENGTSKIGSKGVPRSSKLEVKNFLDKLYDDKSVCAEIRSLKLHDNEMIRCVQKRSALNALFSKFQIDNDRITCTPLRQNNEII